MDKRSDTVNLRARDCGILIWAFCLISWLWVSLFSCPLFPLTLNTNISSLCERIYWELVIIGSLIASAMGAFTWMFELWVGYTVLSLGVHFWARTVIKILGLWVSICFFIHLNSCFSALWSNIPQWNHGLLLPNT